MLTFFALCLLCRIAYSFNDVLIGRLARQHDGMEISAWRGLSLGITMAPLLFWVSRPAWGALAARFGEFLLLVAVTAGANLLQLRAARYLPFGLRAALFVAGVALGGIGLGAWFFHERIRLIELGWSALIVIAAALAAVGDHSSEGLKADVPKGALIILTCSALLSVAALLFARLSRATDALLLAWAWEFGAGVVLLVPLLLRKRRGFEPGVRARMLRTGLFSLPTVIGSGASALALTLGPLGLWSALAGAQALVSAGLGAVWHHERIGPRRWLLFVLGALAVCGLAIARGV